MADRQMEPVPGMTRASSPERLAEARMSADRDSKPDHSACRAAYSALYEQAVEIMDHPPGLGTQRDLLDHRLGTFGHAYHAQAYADLYDENERLQHAREWRACGADEGDQDPDVCPWRLVRDDAEEDGRNLTATMNPPWDHVWLESRTVSAPSKVSELAGTADETRLASETDQPKDI